MGTSATQKTTCDGDVLWDKFCGDCLQWHDVHLHERASWMALQDVHAHFSLPSCLQMCISNVIKDILKLFFCISEHVQQGKWHDDNTRGLHACVMLHCVTVNDSMVDPHQAKADTIIESVAHPQVQLAQCQAHPIAFSMTCKEQNCNVLASDPDSPSISSKVVSCKQNVVGAAQSCLHVAAVLWSTPPLTHCSLFWWQVCVILDAFLRFPWCDTQWATPMRLGALGDICLEKLTRKQFWDGSSFIHRRRPSAVGSY